MLYVGNIVSENFKQSYGFEVMNHTTSIAPGIMPGSLIMKQETSDVNIAEMTQDDWRRVINALDVMKEMAIRRLNGIGNIHENPELMRAE